MKMSELTAIKKFLESHKVHISSEWLEDCVKWCKEEALPQSQTIKDLKEKVFEQWLLLDLRDVEVPCLPLGLATKQKFILNGTYFLQMLDIIDISKPKYWQLQRIRNETPKNLESDNMNSKRVLILTLTDGVQEVKATEYKPIPSLNLNLCPGSKLKLMGPIMVRCGRLLLEDQNVKIIGGEVDTILITNATENVLAKHLNLPLNPNPKRIQECIISNTVELNNKEHATNINLLQVNPNNANVQNFPNVSNNSSHSVNNPLDESDNIFEDDKINEELEMMMQIHQEIDNSSVAIKKSGVRKTPDMFEDMEVDAWTFNNMPAQHRNIKNSKEDELNEPDGVVIDLSESLDEEMHVFENIDIPNDRPVQINSSNELNLKDTSKIPNSFNLQCEIEEIQNNQKYEIKTDIWSIQKLKNNLPNINKGKFKINAKFKTIIEKLTLIDKKFHLVMEVEDESNSIIVKLDDTLVANLARCTATQLIDLKSQILENVSSAHAKALEAFNTLKENLVKFDNLVYVRIEANEKFPLLIEIIE